MGLEREPDFLDLWFGTFLGGDFKVLIVHSFTIPYQRVSSPTVIIVFILSTEVGTRGRSTRS